MRQLSVTGGLRTGDRGAIKLVIEKHNGEKVHQEEFDPREKDILTKKLHQGIEGGYVHGDEKPGGTRRIPLKNTKTGD